MAELTFKQAHDLGVQLSKIASIIQAYREEERDKLTNEEDKLLETAEYSILKQSNELLIHSATFVMAEAEESLESIKIITGEIKKTYRKLKNIQKAIDVFTAVVSVGAAVVARDPQQILNSLGDLKEKWKSLRPENDSADFRQSEVPKTNEEGNGEAGKDKPKTE